MRNTSNNSFITFKTCGVKFCPKSFKTFDNN